MRGNRARFVRELHRALGGSLYNLRRIWLPYGAIYVATHTRDGGVNLNSLYVNSTQRGRGFGEYMLRHILVIGDRLRIPLYLRAHAYGSMGVKPDTAKLRQWYARFGFFDCGGPWMVRHPRRRGSVRLLPRPRVRRPRS